MFASVRQLGHKGRNVEDDVEGQVAEVLREFELALVSLEGRV